MKKTHSCLVIFSLTKFCLLFLLKKCYDFKVNSKCFLLHKKEKLKNKNILYLYTSIILLIISVVEILSTKDKIFTSPPFFSTTFVSGKSSFL